VGVGAGEPFGVVVGAGEVVADGGLQMPACPHALRYSKSARVLLPHIAW